MGIEAVARLLWDVDPAAVDPRRHAAFLVRRAFDEGTIDEIRAVVGLVGRDAVAAAAGRPPRGMTPRGRALLRVLAV